MATDCLVLISCGHCFHAWKAWLSQVDSGNAHCPLCDQIADMGDCVVQDGLTERERNDIT